MPSYFRKRTKLKLSGNLENLIFRFFEDDEACNTELFDAGFDVPKTLNETEINYP